MGDTTDRGFRIDRFVDANGEQCSLQESSACHDEGLIWLGCSEIGLKKFTPQGGWEEVALEYDMQNGVTHVANTRMHLTQSHVKALLPALKYFAKHGALPR